VFPAKALNSVIEQVGKVLNEMRVASQKKQSPELMTQVSCPEIAFDDVNGSATSVPIVEMRDRGKKAKTPQEYTKHSIKKFHDLRSGDVKIRGIVNLFKLLV
jgi:hypothetical protein